MSTVKIETFDNRIYLTAPYNDRLPSKAKAIGGRWSPADKAWHFDPRDEQRVRDLATSIFGTDGTNADLVDVRLTATEAADEFGGIELGGRTIAERRRRDDPVTLGEGVVRASGTFTPGGAGTGGSVRYPRFGWDEHLVLEVRDVPRSVVEGDWPGFTLEIIEDRLDHDALRAEQARIEERLREIDTLLSGEERHV